MLLRQSTETAREYYNSYVKLFKALGGGWITKDGADGPLTQNTGTIRHRDD